MSQFLPVRLVPLPPPRGGPITTASPQALVYAPQDLYLLALDELPDGELRTFRIERILSARLTPQPARRDPAFDPEDYLAGSLGIHSPEHPPRRIRLLVHADRAARLISENPWHPSQQLSRRRSGGWDLTLELTSTRELIPRVLALGPEAELVEPQDVRDEIAGLICRAGTRYGGQGAGDPMDRGPDLSGESRRIAVHEAPLRCSDRL